MAGGYKPGPLRDWGGEPPWGGSLLPLDRPSMRPDFCDPGGFEPETSARWGIRLPWNQPGQPFFADAGDLLDSLMARLDRLADLDELTKLVARILGPHSFALGVIYGAGEAFVVSVIDLLGLFKTFVLADLHDAARRNPAWTISAPGGVASYLTAHMLEKYFGEEMMHAADERDALVGELKAIFESPVDFWGRVGDEYARKYRQFLALSADPTLAGQFQAGRIFGELLLDALALIGAGAAVAKGLARVPRLARLGRTLKGKFSRRIGAAGGEAEAAGGPGLPPARGSSSSGARAMKEPKAIDSDIPAVEAVSPRPGQMPRGFQDAKAFGDFKDTLGEGLTNAGYGDAGALFQGSSVTGKSFRTGSPFDSGRVSDFDIALSGESLMKKATEIGVPLRSGGVRTGPLTDAQLKKLGLDQMRNQLSQQAGRPVNFMIYSTAEEAMKKAPSIPVR